MSAFVLVVLALLTWGAFAFGAVLPWAYWPLAIACGAVGVWGCAAARRAGKRLAPRAVFWPLATVALAGSLQLVPLPRGVVEFISPRHIVLDSATTPTLRPLSVEPRDTARVLVLFGLFAVFFIGLTSALTDRDVSVLAAGILVLGLVLSVSGLIVRPVLPKFVEELSDGASVNVTTQPAMEREANPSDTFGPFGNRNHFAGWMLMAAPLAAAHLFSRWAHPTMPSAAQTSRVSILQREGVVLLAAISLLAMGLAVFATQSRSGIGCLVGSLLLIAAVASRRVRGGRRGIAISCAASVVLIVVLATVSGSFESVVQRFAKLGDTDFGGRLSIWVDATAIAVDFPVAGTGLGTYERAAEVYGRTSFTQEAAHNDYLELLAGGGVLVAFPTLVLLVCIGREMVMRLKAADPSVIAAVRIGAVVGLFAIALQECFDFSLQIPGNTALGVVLAAIAVRKPHMTAAHRPLEYSGS